MSFHHSPSIVKNGLVLCLDAKDLKSYSSSGTTWTDRSGLGNNGTLVNGVGYSNGAMVFDGVNDYVTVPTNTSIDLINTVSLESYIKYTTTINTVCIEKSANNTHYQFQVFSNTQGTIGVAGELVFMLQPNDKNWVVSKESSNDGNWHHVVGTYDRSLTTAKIYIDGILKNTNSSILYGPASNNQPLLIGSRTGLAGFGGSISLIRIYNRALSPEEILQNYNATKSRFQL